MRVALRRVVDFAISESNDRMSEDAALARISIALAGIFTHAQALALARPVIKICGVEVPSPVMGCVSFLKDPGELPAATAPDTLSDPTDLDPAEYVPFVAPSQASRPGAAQHDRAEITPDPAHFDAHGVAVDGYEPFPPALRASPVSVLPDGGARDRGGNIKNSSTRTHRRVGRALDARVQFTLGGIPRERTAKHSSKHFRKGRKSTELKLIVDSGCTWHGMPTSRRSDLLNFKEYSETLVAKADSEALIGINGARCVVKGIGDLPLYVVDRSNHLQIILIRNVRIIENFTDILLSVDQLWEECGVEARFAGHKDVLVPAKSGQPQLSIPFQRREGVFILSAQPAAQHVRDGLVRQPRVLAAASRRPGTTSHLDRLPVNDASLALQRRLQLPASSVSKLPKLTADAPKSLNKIDVDSSGHLTEANAPRLPHTGSVYKPSYVGRLIHGDIVGPFVSSHVSHYRYALVLVDDHSRLKAVYCMKKKSEALQSVRRYVAGLNALISKGSSEPRYAVGSLQTDNAGEFLSKEFNEFIDQELIDHRTCPPHVHALNGVAERAIRTIMDHVRAALLLSNAPKSFWAYAMDHAIDVINRTSGPPGDTRTSYEVATGDAPKVMSILPFGCRAYAVKPISQYAKTNIPAKAWQGVNLGRVASIPNAYYIWLPVEGKVVHSSDVHFDEGYMPMRARGDERVGPAVPVAAPPDDSPADVLSIGEGVPVPEKPEALATTISEAYKSATSLRRSDGKAKILLLFSGPSRRPDGIDVFLNRLGYECVLFDMLQGDDVLNDDTYDQLKARIKSGEFFAVLAAPPCSTVSISRFFDSSSSADGGPRPSFANEAIQ